tara:strand:+ start:1892 stop:3133 length:1242 start_codon:yes stop_codon:yes gene_type:complete
MGRYHKRRMSPKEKTRIKRAIDDKINFFAPTISPAPKNVERNEIESLYEAMKFYRDAGVEEVIIQPKYMGSYCDIYLHRDINKSRFFSRRGYPVRLPEGLLIGAVQNMWDHFFGPQSIGFLNNQIEMMIIQSELMPWSALGRGLVERDFGGYKISHATHHSYIDRTGLNKEVQGFLQDPVYHEFLIDKGTMSRKELKAKYKPHVVSHYDALAKISVPDPVDYKKGIDIYTEQVERYGAPGEVHFKAFNILKILKTDGEEIIPDDHKMFNMVVESGNPGAMSVNVNTEPDVFEKGVAAAYFFYETLISAPLHMEGIIVKPTEKWNSTLVPMFKVRSDYYLQMIYGVNFLANYNYYLGRRNTNRKMRASLNQWNIAQALLRIPTKDISPDNEEYVKLVKARIMEEDFEKTIDSRL